MKKIEGCFPAIVTPFNDQGEIDYPTIEKLLDFYEDGNVAGVVVAGTTGESPTITTEEHKKLIRFVVQYVSGRYLVIAGTGANSTAEAIELTEYAQVVDANATLQVTPYYNKPTREGMRLHFLAVADVGLPVILYNVPGRTSKAISVDLVAELFEHENIVAIKEAGGSVDRVSKILNACNITVLSGDDGLTFPMMTLGAKGVISVVANFLPHEVSYLVQEALAGNWDNARDEHFCLYDIFCKMFIETNPIPVKTAMAAMGLIKENFRLPMCPIQPDNRKILLESMRKIGIET